MNLKQKGIQILEELKSHAPFTLAGAAAGLAFMLVFKGIDKDHARIMFSFFHPSHVFLSAMVTASVFAVHYFKKNFIKVLLIGYFGSIGVATLSDSIVPFIGEKIFSLDVPTHAHHHGEHGHEEEGHEHTIVENEHACEHEAEAVHETIEECNNEICTGDHDHEGHTHEHDESAEHHHADEHQGAKLHLGFVHEWYIVHPVAILGVIIAWYIPKSKCPHAAHVLLSTWASTAHILMHSHVSLTPGVIAEIFGILFIAVWLPCCISDIVFPMLFVDSELAKSGMCGCHSNKHCKEEKGNE